MELTQLQYFKTIAEQQSIKKASELLHVSQPSLSVSLSRLENELGVRLFDRVNRSIRLNAIGQFYLEHVNHIFNELNDAKAAITDGNGSVPNTVRFASTVHGLCNDVVNLYLQEHLQTTFYYYSHGAHTVLDLLKNGNIDFAVSTAPFNSNEINWQPLMDEYLAIVVNQNHPFTQYSYVELSDLKDEKLIIQNAAMNLAGEYEDILLANGIIPSQVFFTNELETAFLAAELGLGALIVSSLTANRLMKNPTHATQSIPLYTRYATHTIGIAKLNGHYLTAPVQQFYDFTVQHFTELSRQQERKWEHILFSGKKVFSEA